MGLDRDRLNPKLGFGSRCLPLMAVESSMAEVTRSSREDTSASSSFFKIGVMINLDEAISDDTWNCGWMTCHAEKAMAWILAVRLDIKEGGGVRPARSKAGKEQEREERGREGGAMEDRDNSESERAEQTESEQQSESVRNEWAEASLPPLPPT